ncbi:MAG: fibronectin type III domain-containing protein [candidate division Zixibacteria bacterium]|nr:fibronectin type III domain-containing protein [candidate division Zixibacteria bacterium]
MREMSPHQLSDTFRFVVLSIIVSVLILLPISDVQAQLRLASTSNNSVILSWTAPGDDGTEGTASQYDIRYSTSLIDDASWNNATQATDEPSPQIAGGIETFEVTELDPGTTYYFAIKTADEVPNWSTLSNVVSFRFNTAPSPPIPQSPPNDSIISSLAPLLIVGNGTDADGDTLTYDFELYNEAADVLLADSTEIAEGIDYTQWRVPGDLLADSTSYSWRVRCYDGELYSEWTDTVRFAVDLNADVNLPPTMPTHLSPANNSMISTSTTQIVLVIENAIDPEGDVLSYDFRIYSDAQLTQLVEAQIDVPEAQSQTSVTLDFTPVKGRTYWWQVRANDGENVTAYTTATRFDYNDLATGGEETEAGASGPTGDQVILTSRPVLTAANATVDEQKYYYFEVATDSDFVGRVIASPGIPEETDGSTSWQVDEELESNQDHYWRVRVNDYAYSPVAKFHVAVDVFAAPNPVHLSNQVTFHLPDEPYDLMIQTVSGETVIIKEGVSIEWEWNLNNAAGNQVAVGVYLWYLTGTDARGKIIVKP